MSNNKPESDEQVILFLSIEPVRDKCSWTKDKPPQKNNLIIGTERESGTCRLFWWKSDGIDNKALCGLSSSRDAVNWKTASLWDSQLVSDRNERLGRDYYFLVFPTATQHTNEMKATGISCCPPLSLIKTVNCARRVWPTFSAWMTGQNLFLFFSFFFPPDTEIKTCVGRTNCWSVGGLLTSADRARWLHGFSFLFFFFAGKSSPAVCFQQRIAWAAAVRCRDNLRPPSFFFLFQPRLSVSLLFVDGVVLTIYVSVLSRPARALPDVPAHSLRIVYSSSSSSSSFFHMYMGHSAG